MKLDLFILGCVSEKPIKVKSLLEIAEYVKLNKWLSYTPEKFVERLSVLSKLDYVKCYENNGDPIEKHFFSSTELGVEYLHNNLKTYIKSNEIDMGMIILFLTFSNHLSRIEVIALIEKKIESMNIKLKRIEERKNDSEELGDNKMREISLKAFVEFGKSEVLIYEELLYYAKEHEEWDDFLVLKDKWEYRV